ncbi:MAG: cyclodeaminase/cyclohydrolase family protein [Acidobacteria bacterium]|nr:cyclodeaminase/cyclohydrolase family protein [Acidobacteriota bacterium]
MDEFLDTLAAPTPAPGGGSAAAAAAALAAALGSMVSGIAKLPMLDAFEADRRFFAEAVKRDAEAYSAVVAAHKIPKAERGAALETALHNAAKVPLEVAEEAIGLRERLRTLASTASEKFSSDIEVAEDLAKAAFDGAVANVRINLEAMSDQQLIQSIRDRLAKLE